MPDLDGETRSQRPAGKADVDVGVLRSVVLQGPCASASAVVNGTWTLDDLDPDDECDFCHLVWCLADNDA